MAVNKIYNTEMEIAHLLEKAVYVQLLLSTSCSTGFDEANSIFKLTQNEPMIRNSDIMMHERYFIAATLRLNSFIY